MTDKRDPEQRRGRPDCSRAAAAPGQPRRWRFTDMPTFASLRLRDYRLLWLGQVSTSMGQWMDQVTRGWLLYQLTGSALSLGLAAALRGLPLLFF